MDDWRTELTAARRALPMLNQAIGKLEDAEFKIPELLRDEYRQADVALKKLEEAVQFYIEVTESGDY